MGTSVIDITAGGGSTWRIQPMGDHYAVIKNEMLIGTVERSYGDGWGFYTIGGGSLLSNVPLRMALDEAKRECEKP